MKGCRTCTYWLAIGEFLERIDPATANQKVQLGQCRRYAPRPASEAAGCESRWPRVASDDWCGEWDPKLV